MADKEEIKDRTDIVELIHTFVPLKQRGRSYLGLCPFHQEKTPSFNVSPTTRGFKCFGCGASGDAFTFVEKYNNMTFVEAAEFLARRAGLTFDRIGGESQGERAGERDQLFGVNGAALAWFSRTLERKPVARDYVYGRGLVHETIQRFQLGYAPDGWDNLASHLQSSGFDPRVSSAAGLIQMSKSGNYIDAFRHRVIFPILDEQERVVGFGGRAFGDDQPKYLNTGETPIFNKSRLLYGLSLARRKISSEGRVLLMEGYMDVIAAHQAGFTNAVATLGTSLTRDHAKKLAQLAPVVALVYDGDNAGIKATLRAAEVFKEVQDEGVREVDLRMVRLPDGEDPDSVLKRGDVAMFQRAMDDAGQYVDYLVDAAKRRQNLSTEEGKTKFLSDLSRILIDVHDPETVDRHIAKFVDLHPRAKLSLDSAAKQMREDLAERKRRVRSRVRTPRPVTSSETASPGSTIESQPAGNAEHTPPGSPQGSDSTAAGQAPKPSAESPARRPPERPYRPPLTREARAELERKRFFQSVRPIESPSRVSTTEERAENELIRALMEPEWRQSVLKHIAPSDYLTALGQRLAVLVWENSSHMGSEQDALMRLVETQHDDDFSAAVRDLAQEFQARMANVPITDEAISKASATLRRHRRMRRYKEVEEELSQLLQKTPLSESERVLERNLTQERQQILKELKGSV